MSTVASKATENCESTIPDIDEEEEEEEQMSMAGAETESSETSEDDSELKKRKKRKKKKKKSPSEEDVAAERRFQQSLQMLRADSGDDLWVKIEKINLDNNKLSQLCAALRKNTSVLSLDLSDVEGMDGVAVETLCGTLKDGAAPDLIELKVPPLQSSDAKVTFSELSKARKNIRVQTCTTAKPPVQQSNDQSSTNGKPSSRNGKFAQNSSIVRKYFQVGNEDEDDNENDEVQGHKFPFGAAVGDDEDNFSSSSYVEPEQHAALLWDRVSDSALIVVVMCNFRQYVANVKR